MARTVLVDWRRKLVPAANPFPIAATNFDLSVPTIRRTERAAAAARPVGARASTALEVSSRLLLRGEALASSAIDDLHARAADVALVEAAGRGVTSDGVATQVADNLAALVDALDETGPIDQACLSEWHRRLTHHASESFDAQPGPWRDELAWAGGPNPHLAAHVGAPADLIDVLMKDLVDFFERDDLDAVTQAAVAHAQFETILPFADGNGRMGRILVAVLLERRLALPCPPPISLELSRDVGGYQSGLARFREGHVDAWVAWFSGAVARAGARMISVLDAVAALEEDWKDATSRIRVDSAARRLLPHLPRHPVLSATTVSSLVGVSAQASRVALDALAEARVVEEIQPVPHGAGRPQRWWAANDLLELIGR